MNMVNKPAYKYARGNMLTLAFSTKNLESR